MRKIFIADDEALARRAFITMVHKNLPHLEIAGEAENGRQACEQIAKLRPDIIAMDIKMPVMNGLEASRIVLQEFPQAQILMLTAYDSFDYLKEALELGVKGYLLKPLKAEELVERVSTILQDLDKAQAQKNRFVDMQNSFVHAASIIEKELVSAYINGKENEQSYKFYQDFLQIDVRAGYFIVLSIDFLCEASLADTIRLNIYKDKVRAIVKEILAYTFGKALVGKMTANLLPIFIPLSNSSNHSFALQQGKLVASEIINRISNQLDWTCKCAIGQIYNCAEKFYQSYGEAISILPACGANMIEVYSPKHSISFTYPYEKENELMNAILERNAKKAKLFASQILQSIFTSGCSFNQNKEYVMELFVMMKRNLNNIGIDLEQVEKRFKISFLEHIDQVGTLHQFAQTLTDFLYRVLKEFNQNKNLALVHKIHRYFTQTDVLNISLESLAKELNLSTQYVSRIFKEELGQNFIDYLTNYKIEKAKQMLKEKQKNISDISIAVGYNDPNYFCRIFKKTTGMTPKEFRKLG